MLSLNIFLILSAIPVNYVVISCQLRVIICFIDLENIWIKSCKLEIYSSWRFLSIVMANTNLIDDNSLSDDCKDNFNTSSFSRRGQILASDFTGELDIYLQLILLGKKTFFSKLEGFVFLQRLYCWRRMAFVKRPIFGIMSIIKGIHLTGAATNPWIRFEFDDSFNPIQQGGGVYLPPPSQDFFIYDRKTVSEGGESGM